MSVDEYDWAFRCEWQRAVRDAKLSLSTRAVLLTLASYVDMDLRSCCPSQKTLANDCNCSLSTIKRAIKEAKKAGFIYAQQRLMSGRRLSDFYQLTLPGSTS